MRSRIRKAAAAARERNHTEAIGYERTCIYLCLDLFCSAFHQEAHHVTRSWAINVRVNLTTVSQAKLPLNWPQKSM